MVSKGKGRIFKRADGKYLIYLPLNVATDSMFPFDLSTKNSERVKVFFDVEKQQVIIEKIRERSKEAW